MKILLCAATQMEIAPTVQQLELPNSNVHFAITGIGLMAATYSLTKAVALHQPGLLIQAGVAGTFDEAQLLGTTVVVQSETVGDLGVEENESLKSLFDLSLLNPNIYPWRNEKLVNTNKVVTACGLPVVNGITVNEISTSKQRIRKYQIKYDAQVESMEGAALHYIGLMEGIPFLQLRSLSNFVGERDKTQWKMKDAIVNLNNELQRLLKNITA